MKHMENHSVFRCHSVYLIPTELLPNSLEALNACQSVALALKGAVSQTVPWLWGPGTGMGGALQGSGRLSPAGKMPSKALNWAQETSWDGAVPEHPREMPADRAAPLSAPGGILPSRNFSVYT